MASHDQRPVSIEPAGPWIPDGLTSLARAAEAEGIHIVRAVIDRWVDGSLRFERPGETILAAVADGDRADGDRADGDRASGSGVVVAVGGITECPTTDGALRVRRFYVRPDQRRRGVARALATELVAAGLRHTPTITCHAGASDAAAPFWEAMGFERVDRPGITHIRHRQRR